MQVRIAYQIGDSRALQRIRLKRRIAVEGGRSLRPHQRRAQRLHLRGAGPVDGRVRRVGQLRRIARRAGISLHERKRRKLLGSLEQLADVGRAVGDLPAPAEAHAIDDGPVDQHLVGLVVLAGVVVGLAKAELEVHVFRALLSAQKGHEQLAVDLLDLRLTDGLTHRKERSRLVEHGLRSVHRVGKVRVLVDARRQAGRKTHLAGRHFRYGALHVELGHVLGHFPRRLGLCEHGLLAIVRRRLTFRVAADAIHRGET